MLLPFASHPPHRFIRNTAVAAVLLCGGLTFATAQSLGVKAFVISKSNCKINTTNLLLAFGNINPTSATSATASANGTVTCNGGKDPTVAVALSLDTGSHPSGGVRRMQHTTLTSEYMRYGVSILPATAIINRNSTLAFTVNGTIPASDFQNVMAGNYSDTVIINVAP